MSEIEELKKEIERLKSLEISKAMCCYKNERKIKTVIEVLIETIDFLKNGTCSDE